MCYDYMNGNICKHLHRIYSLEQDEEPVVASTELNLADEGDLTATIEPLTDTNKPYSFPHNDSRSKGNY